MNADDTLLAATLGEVSYLLGKYDKAESHWRGILQSVAGAHKERLEKCLVSISDGFLPRVAPVDYLEAAGVAFELHSMGEYEEAGAILSDILDDDAFAKNFPLPQLSYVLGVCCEKMAMPQYAKEHYRHALALDPDFIEASQALDALSS
jgi:tetratricopeptide (TPR) repeat protein